MTMKSICVLDGDHNSNLSDCIVALPGKNGGVSGSRMSPEELLFKYSEHLFDTDDPFWIDPIVLSRGYSKAFYLDRIRAKISEYEAAESAGTVTKKRREFNKDLFNKEKGFFEFLFKHWLHNHSNSTELHRFYRELRILFKKIAPYNEINPAEWK